MNLATKAIGIINVCLGVLAIAGSALTLRTAFPPRPSPGEKELHAMIGFLGAVRGLVAERCMAYAKDESRKAALAEKLRESKREDTEREAEFRQSLESHLFRMKLALGLWIAASVFLLASGAFLLRGARWARRTTPPALALIVLAAIAGFVIMQCGWTPGVEPLNRSLPGTWRVVQVSIALACAGLWIIYPIVAIILLRRSGRPVREIGELRGFAEGIDTTIERDDDRV